MKKTVFLTFIIMLTAFIVFTACSENAKTMPSDGMIYLYGETHGVEKIMDRQLELWGEYYNGEDMRHLFIELPYYTAEYLNLWMGSDNDDILEEIYTDMAGTAMQVPYMKVFYKTIKENYPETVFYGTDVGHQYDTIGRRYLDYLTENGMNDSDKYKSAVESIEQGKHYYRNGGRDNIYREDKMAENFIREFDKLGGEDIMGIYGSAHIPLSGFVNASDGHPNMANQLKKRYGTNIRSEDLSGLALNNEPRRIDTIFAGGKEYNASYFGEQDISSLGIEYIKREFWRLESAYADFSGKKKAGDTLPYDNYPMQVEKSQVFVIDYTKANGEVDRKYYRSDGNEWNGRLSTEQFLLD